MYARVAAFQNFDVSQLDRLIAIVQERARTAPDVPEVKRVLMLVDREARSSLGITFFETEDAIARAEPAFERMGEEIPEEMRGKRTSVEVYEVAIEEVADGARAARVSSLEGSAEQIDEGIGFVRDQLLPAAGDMTGWRGVIALVDRTNGRTRTITFWDGEESLKASEERANQIRRQAAEAMDERITGVDRYEVALDRVVSPTPA